MTGTKNPDISQEGTFRISKLFFYTTTKRCPNPIFEVISWTHIFSQAAAVHNIWTVLIYKVFHLQLTSS
jgi:hypothetical protein